MNAIRCLVEGRVQGVFFRASTKQVADRLSLSGHAINLPDGRVEVLAKGPEQQLDELRAYLLQGPSHAEVISLECESWNEEIPDGFHTG